MVLPPRTEVSFLLVSCGVSDSVSGTHPDSSVSVTAPEVNEIIKVVSRVVVSRDYTIRRSRRYYSMVSYPPLNKRVTGPPTFRL